VFNCGLIVEMKSRRRLDTDRRRTFILVADGCRGESCTTWPRLWHGAWLEAATRRGRQSVSV